MSEILKMAWRNIWRNRRRTLITASSVLFAVFFAIVMRSMQLGTYSNMTANVVGAYTGYAQVQAQGYWDDKTLDNSLDWTPQAEQAVLAHPRVVGLVPRFDSFALAASDSSSKGVGVVGVLPATEDSMSRLSDKLLEGRLPAPTAAEVLVAERLAVFLKIGLGDTLALIGMGYQGISAVGEYPVVGIVRLPSPQLNASLVYTSLENAQELFAAEGRLTSVVLTLDDPDFAEPTCAELAASLPEGLVALPWQELMPELVQQIESDQASGFLILGILYVIVGFGIFGTLLMMLAERRREMGVMMAVGMGRRALATMVGAEMVLLGTLGTLAGMAAAFPMVLYLHHNPILLEGEMAQAMLNLGVEPIVPFALEPGFFVWQGLLVAALVAVASLHPLLSILKLNVINALRA